MDKSIKGILKEFRFYHLAFLVFINYIIINFLVSLANPAIDSILSNPTYCSGLLLVIFCSTFVLWIYLSLYFKKNNYWIDFSLIVLSPVAFLLFWNTQYEKMWTGIPISIVLTTMICLFFAITKEKSIFSLSAQKYKIYISLLVVIYFVLFSFLAIRQYNSFSLFNPEDFANYNQIFWNTINGNIFRSSLYYSNFACHNSLFYFLIVPFYRLIPHPLTLMLIKTLLLSLSIIPFYLIAKDMQIEKAIMPLLPAFLLYPYLVSQNFGPPHEISYLPFFLLWTYYFFKKEQFGAFIVFLVLSLSIKEHISLIAIMLGLYAWFNKRKKKWIFTAILLGIVWGVISYAIIRHFQNTYHVYGAWLLSNVRQIISLQWDKISTFNIFRIYSLKLASPLIFSLGVIPTFLSPIGLLGIPEFALNLIADRPDVLTPARHYNIVVSCFLLIAAMDGLRRISNFYWIEKLRIKPQKIILLSSICILSLTLMHSYTWLWMGQPSKDKEYIYTINQALSHIPPDSSVVVPKNIVVHVSSRPDYSFFGQTQYIKNKKRKNPEFILCDKDNSRYLAQYNICNDYKLIFNKENIRVFKKAGYRK